MIETIVLMIGIGVGVAFALAVVIWKLVRRRGAGTVKGLGGVSEQWMTEQRAHDDDWRRRWG